MRFGVCTSVKKLPLLKEAGFDYIELNFSILTAMTDEEFLFTAEELDRFGMKAEAYNGFFPGDMPLYTVSDEEILAYAEKGFSRASRLGGAVAVLGSGKARSIPLGEDYEAYRKRFAHILTLCGDVAAKYQMTIALEPLSAKECNLIHTVEEGMAFCREIGHPAVKCLADYFHMFSSGEDFCAIIEGGDLLAHVHLARRHEDRRIPSAEDISDCKLLADALKKSGYDARISLEGHFEPDYPTALREVQPVLALFSQ